MEKKRFNVLLWDFNTDNITEMDVMPYFREQYEKVKKKKDAPKTFEDIKTFIKGWSLYQFWSRCQYEMICHGFPKQKNEYKLDVHHQIMCNLDLIADILYEEILDKRMKNYYNKIKKEE